MKIAHVTKYFHPHRGGIESHVLGISEEFVARGNDVLVFTSNKPESQRREDVEGITVLRSRVFFTLFNGPFAPGIFADLMKEDYDLIHLHLPDPFNSVFALAASKIRGKPLFVTYHADIIKDRWYHIPFKFAYWFFMYAVLSSAVRIFLTTPNYVAGSQIPNKHRRKVEIVHNFVDAERFNPELSGARIRKEYSLENKKMILFLGRLVPYKGVEYLIKAYAKVKVSVKDAVLVIAGSGPLEDELKKMACDLKAEDALFVKAADDEIPEYYAACDVFVLPSVTRQEAFGIALLEAMASGKPTITTNISGMPYVVGDAGITVSPRDADALSSAIIAILSDQNLAKELGKKGRERVEKEFRKEIVAEKILKAYHSY